MVVEVVDHPIQQQQQQPIHHKVKVVEEVEVDHQLVLHVEEDE